MKNFRLLALGAFFFATLGLRALHAQQGGNPDDEIITDFGVDEYIYTPKLTLNVGIRSLSGARSSFSGRGIVRSFVPPDDYTTPNVTRGYNDGSVLPDARSITDPDGITTPITPDGYTNSWSYAYPGQLQSDGNLAFHGYTADIGDPGVRDSKGDNSWGVEVVVARDMGKIGKRFDWKLFGGVSLNDVNSSRTAMLPATVTTTTDYYSLNGQTPPAAPYSAPTTGTSIVVASDGTIINVPTDNSVLLGNVPLGRTVTVTNGLVSERWKLKGGYFTFRGGPSLTYAITSKFKASLSVGAALVFVGSTYTVDQIYVPDVGGDVINTVDDTTAKLLPGYYADATLEYDFTERAAAYAGAVYQSNGSYEQNIATADAKYATTVDLASLQGFRMGMNFRF